MRGFLAASLLWLSCPAMAQEWQVGCDATGCKVGQAIIENDSMVARVLVLQMQGNEVIEVLFPLGVSLLTPVYLHIDDRKEFEVRTASCDGTGCYGIVPDAKGAVAAFKAGSEMKLRFTGFQDGKTYFFPFTLAGFTAAYETYQSKAGRAQP